MKRIYYATLLILVLVLDDSQPLYRVHEPAGFTEGDPVTIVIWLHGYRMNENQCPLVNHDQGRVVVAPVFNRDAVWRNYDMRALIDQLRDDYNVTNFEIEGFSRGAYGAAYHAAENPGLFSEVRCLAGRFDDYPMVRDPLIVIGGSLDSRVYGDSVAFADASDVELITIVSGHDPVEFYDVCFRSGCCESTDATPIRSPNL